MLRDKIKVAALIVAVAVLTAWCNQAHADGLPKGGSILPIGEAVKAGSWSGLGLGVYGSHIKGTDDVPSTAGLTLSATLQFGSLVLEGFGDYGLGFGDLDGLKEAAIGVRLGYLLTPNAMIYGLGAKAWDISSDDTANKWQYGGGVAYRFSGTPTEVKIEYRRSEYDGGDATDALLAILSFRLNAK
jgi:hypothetical protein